MVQSSLKIVDLQDHKSAPALPALKSFITILSVHRHINYYPAVSSDYYHLSIFFPSFAIDATVGIPTPAVPILLGPSTAATEEFLFPMSGY